MGFALSPQQRTGEKAAGAAGQLGASDSMPRFVPRHADELELEVDDPLLVEVQAEDYWYEAYNMRTGDRGIFPAYYAIEVTKEPDHVTGMTSLREACWRPPLCVHLLSAEQSLALSRGT